MSTTDREKLEAARSAAEFVEQGMVVGLGSGTTAELMIRRLGERNRSEGLKITAVATSVATERLARECGIHVIDLDSVETLDLGIDGADEVDPQFRLIKGRGGALLREKIVAAAAGRRIIVVTPDKRVDRLGSLAPVPIEVSAFGVKHTQHALRNLGARPALRMGLTGVPVKTDEGHLIIDCRFDAIDDPVALDVRLQRIPGVFETGIFIDLCDILVVGRIDGADHIDVAAARRST
jgi:ribose 5-phosphate isomerase A